MWPHCQHWASPTAEHAVDRMHTVNRLVGCIDLKILLCERMSKSKLKYIYSYLFGLDCCSPLKPSPSPLSELIILTRPGTLLASPGHSGQEQIPTISSGPQLWHRCVQCCPKLKMFREGLQECLLMTNRLTGRQTYWCVFAHKNCEYWCTSMSKL